MVRGELLAADAVLPSLDAGRPDLVSQGQSSLANLEI